MYAGKRNGQTRSQNQHSQPSKRRISRTEKCCAWRKYGRPLPLIRQIELNLRDMRPSYQRSNVNFSRNRQFPNLQSTSQKYKPYQNEIPLACFSFDSEQNGVLSRYLDRIFVIYGIPEGNNVTQCRKMAREQTGSMALMDIGKDEVVLQTGLCQKT